MFLIRHLRNTFCCARTSRPFCSQDRLESNRRSATSGSFAVSWCSAIVLVVVAVTRPCAAAERDRPNVIVIMTDDQGFGDLGCHGNPVIRTPNLDRFAEQSVHAKSFYVCPVCAPTRAALMTGRYNYRTGVTDTYLGRAMMHADEVTLAEMLTNAGYRTAIFGKWHLGDNYPMRPQDQGFQEVLVHKGGGLCQPAGPPNNSYFDPVLEHNGSDIKTEGYCSDVYMDYLLEFLQKHRREPMFIYLPFNCPHGPYQVAEKYSKPYEQMNLKPEDFPDVGHPIGRLSPNTEAVYGMVENVDENLGRLFKRLEELDLADNTLIFFLTDNGPNGSRYNAGMLAHKGSVHEGGIRVPLLVRWPARLKPGRTIEQVAAHIDLAPTILEACGVQAPEQVKFDGRSLLPLLEGRNTEWPDRTYYVQWHRGDAPVRYRAFAARNAKYKLVCPNRRDTSTNPEEVDFQLYDMQADPLEMNDIAGEKPEIVEQMRRGYDAWLDDVSRDHGYEAPKIHIGTPHENPSILTRQDWRGPNASWSNDGLGYWELAVPKSGTFEVTCNVPPLKRAATATLQIQDKQYTVDLEPGTEHYGFPEIALKASDAERLETWVEEEGREKPYGVMFVFVERVQ